MTLLPFNRYKTLGPVPCAQFPFYSIVIKYQKLVQIEKRCVYPVIIINANLQYSAFS